VARLAVACLDVAGARRVAAIDRANEQYGPWTVFPARMLGTEDEVQDRISFGTVGEIE